MLTDEPAILTVTSANYLGHTRLMLQSLRQWHPRALVFVYALATDWTSQESELLAPYQVIVRTVAERNVIHRSASTVQTGLHNVFKLDVLKELDSKVYLYLDGDILVLRPLTPLFDRIRQDGLALVHDHSPLSACWKGPITQRMALPDALANQRCFNSGVIGVNVIKTPIWNQVVEQAWQWGQEIDSIPFGDQSLLNLAWVHRTHQPLPHAGYAYNRGIAQGCFELDTALLHFAGVPEIAGCRDKLELQQRIWNAWPKELRLVSLQETDFWRSSLPHPWPWPNQASQKKHRAFLKQLRLASRSLVGTQGLLIADAAQAYLLHKEVLTWSRTYWSRHASLLKDVPYAPTWDLAPGGQLRDQRRDRRERLWSDLRRMIPGIR